HGHDKNGRRELPEAELLRKFRVSLTGFTLIELVITILLVGILVLAGSQIVISTIQSLVFVSNKARADSVASDIIDSMIKGVGLTKGLRFSRNITAIYDNSRIIFTNQDNQNIEYRLTDENNIKWYINSSFQGYLPYYATQTSGINLAGKNNKLFTYYNASGSEITSPVADVRRVEINLIVRTGSGNFSDWQGYSEQSSSVAVKKFQ
ncbi:MAG: prepilin-type N-terminal cleavage/methylation domain-containing protein, partial [Candidatus Omnitrophota bacterium]|nr:prepilin-type N-terminal cleavage/methylation domain-containing protein [Candidatus Omnitrophota bacterium]